VSDEEEQEWPDDFWLAFEGFPDDFERPAPVPQSWNLDW
jgi:hypothetical protein